VRRNGRVALETARDLPYAAARMLTVADESFMTWLGERGIALDPRYPQGWEHLVYRNAVDEWAEWDLPPAPSDLPGFVAAALRAASPAGPYWVYPRTRGVWHIDADAPPAARAVAGIRRAAGVPDGFVGALGLDARELSQLWMLLSAAFVFSDPRIQDLYVVPDDGSCVLMTCQHDELHVQFRDPERREAFTSAMAASGFELPSDAEDVDAE